MIDEAHFLRNPVAYWGCLAAAIGTHSHRIILATGTPYNNNFQDMASLCSFYNPSSKNHQNQIEWWKRAFDDGQTLDADELEQRWIAERTQREGPSPPIDTDLLADLRSMAASGELMPTVGMAVGVDRLLMSCLGETRLDSVLPLSLPLHEQEPES